MNISSLSLKSQAYVSVFFLKCFHLQKQSFWRHGSQSKLRTSVTELTTFKIENYIFSLKQQTHILCYFIVVQTVITIIHHHLCKILERFILLFSAQCHPCHQCRKIFVYRQSQSLFWLATVLCVAQQQEQLFICCQFYSVNQLHCIAMPAAKDGSHLLFCILCHIVNAWISYGCVSTKAQCHSVSNTP